MKILDVVQGSPEWIDARLGIATASEFDQILTPATLKPSKSAIPYRNRLIAEWLLGAPVDDTPHTYWMERGTMLEPEARAWYEMHHDVEVTPAGFVLRDDEKVGCSPDGLVGDLGGLELKCPTPQVHVGYLIDPDSLVAKYRHQVQGCLYVTGRAWWDIVSYHPELPKVVRRIERDATYIAALTAALDSFLADLGATKERLAPHRLTELQEAA